MENVTFDYKFYRIPKRFLRKSSLVTWQMRQKYYMEYFWIASACQTPIGMHGVMNMELPISSLQLKKLWIWWTWGNKKVNKMLIELEQHSLIYRRHQELGKPNKIYVHDILQPETFEWTPEIQLRKWRNKKWEKCIMKTQKKMQHLNDVPMLSLTWLKIWSTVKKKWAVEEWLRNIHVGCFWKELAVKRYGRYVENMKKWKFGLEKSTAWQYQIDLHMNQIYNKVKMIMT